MTTLIYVGAPLLLLLCCSLVLCIAAGVVYVCGFITNAIFDLFDGKH